ncbi:hypothetical protein Scep_013176 [Stephania cephalantha]|uniref:Uncharacterized protein n=1 Tax=Stephania cephalantha TaxID=152367 RepID=A0AAP0JGI8_9MAGN
MSSISEGSTMCSASRAEDYVVRKLANFHPDIWGDYFLNYTYDDVSDAQAVTGKVNGRIFQGTDGNLIIDIDGLAPATTPCKVSLYTKGGKLNQVAHSLANYATCNIGAVNIHMDCPSFTCST